jgi:hypothetical protein
MKIPHLPSLLILSLMSISGLALADDAAILECRALGDAQARLACYDTILVDAQRPASVANPAIATAAPAPAMSAEQSFGMEAVKHKEAEPRSIESTIVGKFDGWEPGAQIHLANGQVWRVVDGSSAVLPGMDNVRVKVVRNVIGTLFMEIDGTNNSPKVRRVR